MAHFAEVDDNIVKRVLVVADSDCDGGVYPESEEAGQAYLASLGFKGEWRQTSYNNNFRKQYAGIGFRYDPYHDVFIAPQPYSSWSLDENFDWQAPVPYPEDGNDYVWDEVETVWVLA